MLSLGIGTTVLAAVNCAAFSSILGTPAVPISSAGAVSAAAGERMRWFEWATLSFAFAAAVASIAVACWAWVDRPRIVWSRRLQYSRPPQTNEKSQTVTVWALGSAAVSQVKVWVEGANSREERSTMTRESEPITLNAPRPDDDTESYRLEIRWRREHPLARNCEHGFSTNLRTGDEYKWKWRRWRWPVAASRPREGGWQYWPWRLQTPFLTAKHLNESPYNPRGHWKGVHKSHVAIIPKSDDSLRPDN
jgi:hypothetical protein